MKNIEEKFNKRKIGNKHEAIAVEYLKKQGYEILERNFSCKVGEIDIVAKEGNTLCFIEVKYRKNIQYGYPHEAISNFKKFTIVKVAKYYLHKHNYCEDTMIRFDAVLILDSEIYLIKNAFGGLS